MDQPIAYRDIPSQSIKLKGAIELNQAASNALSTAGWCVLSHIDPRIDVGSLVQDMACELAGPDTRLARRPSRLRPRTVVNARPMSLSAKFGLGAFPLHVDTAHWPIPGRYVILGCVDAAGAGSGTRLLHLRSDLFTEPEEQLLRTAVFRVRSGAKSFYATVKARGADYFRFDPGCMEPACAAATDVLTLMKDLSERTEAATIQWKAGQVVIIDNWRALHGREAIALSDERRVLLRVVVHDEASSACF